MGCCHSRVESEEAVSRCKARRRCMKHAVKGRHDFSAAHSTYLRSLRSTGAALLQFANAETTQLHLNQPHHPLPPLLASPPPPPPPPPLSPPPPSPRPPPPPPMSPSSENWASSVTASPALRAPPPPPPPPPPPYSSWDFWDPFLPSSSRSVTEEEWEEAATSASEVTAAPATVPTSSLLSGYSKDTTGDLAMVAVSRGRKDLSEIVKELDEYFHKAADAGTRVSSLLESRNLRLPSNQSLTGRMCSYGKNLSPLVCNPRATRFRRFESSGYETMGGSSHCSTIEKLYAWEKKLYLEVKSSERIRAEQERRVGLLRRQEARGVEYGKVERNRREIQRLESRMAVASQSMEATASEIARLREAELHPQLLQLVNGLMCMWRSMYECHQVQTHIVQQLKYLNKVSNINPTSDIHRQATLQLELEVERWYSAFCNLIKSQKDYIHALMGWLRHSLSKGHPFPLSKTQQNSDIYSLCEEWQLALDRIPDKVASEGIKSFLTVIRSIVAQQAGERKQKRRSESASKEVERKAEELRSLELKFGSYSATEDYREAMRRSPVLEKKAKVEALKVMAEEERSKYETSAGVTRAMTLNNLKTGFPNVFQAMTGFSGVCMKAFESVYSHPRSSSHVLEFKMLLA